MNSKLLACILFPVVIAWTCGSRPLDADDAEVMRAFVAHIGSLQSLSEAQKSSIDSIIQQYQSDSPADVITESLIQIYPGYGDAIEASDGGDIAATRKLLEPFATSSDPFLAADASYYLARSLMNAEDFEAAIPLLNRIDAEFAPYTVQSGNARFYTGVAQAGMLQYSDAINSLTDFLQFHPDAPERLRVAAWRQIQQLQSIAEGQMEDVYQRMDYSRRKLALIEPGDSTQEQQQKIVNMLARLIREQEKKEASSKSQSQNQEQQKQQQQQQQEQQAKKNQQQNRSQTGGQSNQPNGQAITNGYNDGPSSPWSRLRSRSRDPANNAIKEKLPARYRDIVERYYEAANGDSSR